MGIDAKMKKISWEIATGGEWSRDSDIIVCYYKVKNNILITVSCIWASNVAYTLIEHIII